MIGISKRVVLSNKEDITFQAAVDPNFGLEGIKEILDIMSDASERERWKADLADKRQALKVAEQQSGYLDKEIQRLTRERAAAVASFQAAHQARARRSEFSPNDRQKQAIEQYDAQIGAARSSQENFRRDRPIIEWEIDCLVAKIAGQPEPEKPNEVIEAIQMIAEVAA